MLLLIKTGLLRRTFCSQNRATLRII